MSPDRPSSEFRDGCADKSGGTRLIGFGLAAGLILCSGLGVRAQSNDVGKTEYRSSCAPCHGLDGKGDGPVAKDLKVPPADLTVLAKNDGGVFPHDHVLQVIDGRIPVAGHGSHEMPAWGYRFGPPQAFRYKERILAVVDYLRSLQEK